MADEFKLATVVHNGGKPFVALVIGDKAIEVGGSMAALLEDWDRSFDSLQRAAQRFDQSRAIALDALTFLPPVQRPGKILNAASNYRGHVAEMQNWNPGGGHVAQAKSGNSNVEPYLFLKATTSIAGAYDDIVIPGEEYNIDWEGELGAVIGRRCKHVKAERALDVVAGFMTFNDVSCRKRNTRPDRPNLRSDWLAGKSYDTFGPSGPFLVPRAFIPDHRKLRITLTVSGAVKQDGLAGEMIFSAEEQIEYASEFMTLEPGDIFATGTVAGVGQGSNTFLKTGDVVEAEVHGLGRQRNKVVLEKKA
jgi:2-keto-4-pentenoate hydratase/2-oxohepta-3-ene-1,7-dioic acid hydratase in catechol pathway